jgi:hypothetical protein
MEPPENGTEKEEGMSSLEKRDGESARLVQMTPREKELYSKHVAFRAAERRHARKSPFLSDFLSDEDICAEFITESPEEFVMTYRTLSITERRRLEQDLDDGFDASQARLIAASRAALHRPFTKNK